MDISIFGLGYVGCVSLGCLANNGHRVIGVDVNPIKVDQINAGKPTIVEKDIAEIIALVHGEGRVRATADFTEAVLGSDISIVAVGTPSTAEGHLNLSYIFDVAKNIGQALRLKKEFHIVVIRSTVMPGTCEMVANIIGEESGKSHDTDFAVVDNPEFLREGTAVRDYHNPPLTLIGSGNKLAADLVASLYKDLPGELIVTKVRVAEIMKYVNNTYHALKISFANEVGNICKALGIDSHEVMGIFCKDKELNISPYYFKPGFAYGGSCLPKDLKGLQTLAHDHYLSTPVIRSISKTNAIQLERVVEYMSRYRDKKIGFLGISFKAGTDDLRSSPSVDLVEALLGKGFNISIFDENVQLSKLTGTNKEFIDSKIPHFSKLMVSEIEDIASASEVIVVSYNDEKFHETLDKVKGVQIIDLVRLPQRFVELPGYYGINW